MKVVVTNVSRRHDNVQIIGTVDGLHAIATCSIHDINKHGENKRSKYIASVLAHQSGQKGVATEMDHTGEFDVSMDEVAALAQKAESTSASKAAPAATAAPEPVVADKPRQKGEGGTSVAAPR
jgi:hypothetical protein